MRAPPGVSDANFAEALKQFAAAVGPQWVFTDDEDVSTYKDACSPLWGEPEKKSPQRRSLPTASSRFKKSSQSPTEVKGQKPALLEERRDLTPELVALFVRRGGGGAMPSFRPTEVSNDDLKALGAYLARKR